MATWEPRVIQGGAAPRAKPPLSWEHVDDPSGRSRDVVSALWQNASGAWMACVLVIEDGHPPARISGTEPDATTLLELAEDIARWWDYEEGRSNFAARYHA